MADVSRRKEVVILFVIHVDFMRYKKDYKLFFKKKTFFVECKKPEAIFTHAKTVCKMQYVLKSEKKKKSFR